MSDEEYEFQEEEVVADECTEDDEEERRPLKKLKKGGRKIVMRDEEEDQQPAAAAKTTVASGDGAGLAQAVPKSSKYHIVFNRKVFQRFLKPLGAQIKELHLKVEAKHIKCDALNPTHTVMLKAGLEVDAKGVVPAGETFCVNAATMLDAIDFDFDEFVMFRDGDRVGIAAGNHANNLVTNYIDTLAEEPQIIPVVPMNVHFTLLISIKKMREIFKKRQADYVLIKLFEVEGGCVVEFTSQGTGITRTQRINSVMDMEEGASSYSVRASPAQKQGGDVGSEVLVYEGAFASAFVEPLLQHMVGDMVQLQFSTEIKPMIVTYSLGSLDSKIVALFMPKA